MKRVVVITGVAGGIGRATARLFEQEDWVVIGIDQRDPGTSAGVEYFIKADISEVKSSRKKDLYKGASSIRVRRIITVPYSVTLKSKYAKRSSVRSDCRSSSDIVVSLRNSG